MYKLILKLIVLISTPVAVTGCATCHWTDRGRDAADVFTFGFGVGAGAKAKLGPIQSGLIMQTDLIALRGGAIGTKSFNMEKGFGPWSMSYSGDVHLLTIGFENFDPGDRIQIVRMRRKQYRVEQALPFYYKAFSPYHTYEENREMIPYHTQFEIVAALGPSLRLGFNPIEFLDFFLGFFWIDIYNDDLEGKKEKNDYFSKGEI